jgi:mannose-6-phosphate isomerase
MVKYLFTSEKLSVQVHPDEAQAHASGFAGGKDEAWLLVEADPGATIGLGLKTGTDRSRLAAAARDGTIEGLLNWRRVGAGDFLYSPAGTVHALGPGLKLIEIQQNNDITYRLYDYDRSRELHVEQALAVARTEPYRLPFRPQILERGRQLLAARGRFVVERWRGRHSGALTTAVDAPLWIVPLAGSAEIDGEPAEAGSVWMVTDRSDIETSADCSLLLAYSGADVRSVLLHRIQSRRTISIRSAVTG